MRWNAHHTKPPETSPWLISRGNSGDSGDQKMACALTKATPGRRPRRLQTRWQPIPPEVAGTSPAVAATSPQSPWSPAGLGDVAETSPLSRTKLVSATSPHLMETSRRRLRDLLETEKCLQKSEHVWISRDSPETRLVSRRRRGDVAETSPQSAETRVAT